MIIGFDFYDFLMTVQGVKKYGPDTNLEMGLKNKYDYKENW